MTEMYLFTQVAMETICARAVEFVLRFIFQVGFAGSIILATVFITAVQFHRTVFTTVLCSALTEVVGTTIYTCSIDTGPEGRKRAQ